MPFYPNLKQEKKLWRLGYTHVAGLDEAGRGSWAGPIVAGAVILDPKIKIKGIADSKKLRAPVRKKIFDEIVKKSIAWATGIVSAADIDRLGILPANILALKLALQNLAVTPNYFLVDYLKFESEKISGQAITKGDYKVTSIAAASIVAKVFRDELMDELDEKFPAYGFRHHKGYGTNHHFQMLVEHGVSSVHRQSLKPIQDLVKN